jgi:hypothetical protein
MLKAFITSLNKVSDSNRPCMIVLLTQLLKVIWSAPAAKPSPIMTRFFLAPGLPLSNNVVTVCWAYKGKWPRDKTVIMPKITDRYTFGFIFPPPWTDETKFKKAWFPRGNSTPIGFEAI